MPSPQLSGNVTVMRTFESTLKDLQDIYIYIYFHISLLNFLMITFDRKLYNRVLTIPTHRTWRLPTSSASRVRRCSLGTTPGWINHIKTCGFCTCTLTYICAGTGTVKEAFIRPKFMNHCCFFFFPPSLFNTTPNSYYGPLPASFYILMTI